MPLPLVQTELQDHPSCVQLQAGHSTVALPLAQTELQDHPGLRSSCRQGTAQWDFPLRRQSCRTIQAASSCRQGTAQWDFPLRRQSCRTIQACVQLQAGHSTVDLFLCETELSTSNQWGWLRQEGQSTVGLPLVQTELQDHPPQIKHRCIRRPVYVAGKHAQPSVAASAVSVTVLCVARRYSPSNHSKLYQQEQELQPRSPPWPPCRRARRPTSART